MSDALTLIKGSSQSGFLFQIAQCFLATSVLRMESIWWLQADGRERTQRYVFFSCFRFFTTGMSRVFNVFSAMKADSHHLDRVIDWSSRWWVHAAAGCQVVNWFLASASSNRKATWGLRSEMTFTCGGWSTWGWRAVWDLSCWRRKKRGLREEHASFLSERHVEERLQYDDMAKDQIINTKTESRTDSLHSTTTQTEYSLFVEADRTLNSPGSPAVSYFLPVSPLLSRFFSFHMFMNWSQKVSSMNSFPKLKLVFTLKYFLFSVVFSLKFVFHWLDVWSDMITQSQSLYLHRNTSISTSGFILDNVLNTGCISSCPPDCHWLFFSGSDLPFLLCLLLLSHNFLTLFVCIVGPFWMFLLCTRSLLSFCSASTAPHLKPRTFRLHQPTLVLRW